MPDLAPCDIWLFSMLMENLRARKFNADSENILAIQYTLKQLLEKVSLFVFKSGLNDGTRCILPEGRYFEKECIVVNVVFLDFL